MGKISGPSKATIRRLSVYLRCLNRIQGENPECGESSRVISSQRLAALLDLNPAQVRKDLSCFGEFGKRGVGYSVEKLRQDIIKILGLQRQRKVAIVGAGGQLGRALAAYTGFEKRNFRVVALFDKDPTVIGISLGQAGVIHDIRKMPELLQHLEVDILVLTVPAEAIDEVMSVVRSTGIHAVLNFAPVKVSSTEKIDVHNVDLTMELETLSYHLSMREFLLSVDNIPLP